MYVSVAVWMLVLVIVWCSLCFYLAYCFPCTMYGVLLRVVCYFSWWYLVCTGALGCVSPTTVRRVCRSVFGRMW